MSSSRARALAAAGVAVVAAAVAVVVFLLDRAGEEPSRTEAQADSRAGSAASDPSGSSAPGRGAASPADRVDPVAALERREAGDPMALGEVDAPVVMLSYADFQCPFCGRFARTTERTLIDRYVDDGTLRIEWRDFPYLGEESLLAAKAARAAGEQGKFWEFHDELYAEQPPVNSGTITEEHLVGIAEQLDLDVTQFLEVVRDPATTTSIDRDFIRGQRVGVTGTPAFFVNGRPIMGAQPTEVFVDAVERAAAEARSAP
jgi:protein-disulfide isomerase